MLPRRTAGSTYYKSKVHLTPRGRGEIRIDQQGERERGRKMFHKDDSLRVVNIPLVLSNYFALMITWICICAYLIVVTTILIPTGLVLSLSALSWLGCLLSPPSVDLIPLLSVQFLSIVTRISSCRLYLLYFMYWSDLFIHSCIYARSDDGCGAWDLQ